MFSKHCRVPNLDQLGSAHFLIGEAHLGSAHQVVMPILLRQIPHLNVHLPEEHLVVWEMLSGAASPDEHHETTPPGKFNRVESCMEARKTGFVPGHLDFT